MMRLLRTAYKEITIGILQVYVAKSHIGYTYNTRDKTATDLNLHLESGSAARIDADSVVVDENKNVKYFETRAAV